MDLIDTIALMSSTDYKDRFKAEYFQTKIRFMRLSQMIVKYDAGTLEFIPDCPIDLLKNQANAMSEYLHALEVRAEVEKIKL
jgi:hypothetical protein